MTKEEALQSAFDAIQFANEFHLTEKEKSYLCDWVFETATRDTKNDNTVPKQFQYIKPVIN
jgi:hypothetical protein